MNENKAQGIGFFEKYLRLWVLLCMAAGILIGKFLPGIPAVLESCNTQGKTSLSLFSSVVLACTVGVLTEVPVMLPAGALCEQDRPLVPRTDS